MPAPKSAAAPADEESLQFDDLDKCAVDLGGVHTRTVKRMAKRDPDFPKLVVLGGRLHVVRHQWEAYKKLLLVRGTEVRPFPKTFPSKFSATNKNREVPA